MPDPPRGSVLVVGAVILVATYLAPYVIGHGLWWRFAGASAAILLLGWLVKRSDVWRFFGLRLTLAGLGASVAVFVVAFPVSLEAIKSAALASGLEADFALRPRAHAHQFFQVLNDEMVLRAAVLSLLIRRFGHPRMIVVAVAMAFALGHALLYGSADVDVVWRALLTLFSFGVVANALFVRFDHIGFGFALHYAWNFFRFNVVYYLHGQPLPEGATFNYIEGNEQISLVSAALAIVVFVAVFHGRSVMKWTSSL